MPYANEFPALAEVTNNMDARLVYEVGQNLEQYNIDVRIDYERWIQFQTEYGEWSRDTIRNSHSNGEYQDQYSHFKE